MMIFLNNRQGKITYNLLITGSSFSVSYFSLTSLKVGGDPLTLLRMKPITAGIMPHFGSRWRLKRKEGENKGKRAQVALITKSS